MNLLNYCIGEFLLTRPLRGATRLLAKNPSQFWISTHTPLAGRDQQHLSQCHKRFHFYSHAPCGARPHVQGVLGACLSFLLTRPLRGATDGRRRICERAAISTHTPLAGRDINSQGETIDFRISTHTPLAGRDGARVFVPGPEFDFYSHAPCGARPLYPAILCRPAYFYSHAPCGARHHHAHNIRHNV